MPKINVRTRSKNWWDKAPTFKFDFIEAATFEKCFEIYFKEFDNRNKYCNSVEVKIIEESHAKEYKRWFSDVRNYARCGGDMW